MKKLTSSQQVKYGAILSYLGIATYILIGLLYTPWMIKVIGKDDYGLYTLAYSIISLFVFDFGISAAIQRFVAKYLAEKNQEKVDNCVSIVYKLYIYIDIAVLSILSIIFFFIPFIYTELTIDQLNRLKIVYLMAGLFSVLSFPFIPLNGILSAHEKFIQLKTCDLISKVLTVIINIICLSFGGGLYELVATNITVGLLITLVKLTIVRRETKIKINFGYSDRQEMKRILSFSGWTTVVALCQRTIFNIAPSILGMFAGASVIAVFGIAVSLEAYTFAFASALNGLFLPKISRILNDTGDVLPLMIRVGRIQILTIGLIIIGFITVGSDFISCWLGDGYEEAYVCTLLFIIPAFFLLPADIADQTLIASGNVKFRAMVYIVMAVANVILSYFMTKYWGCIGLASSICIAYMIRNVLLYYVYYKKLDINIFEFLKESYGKMLVGLLLSLIISLAICHIIELNGWLNVIVEVLIVTTCYIICMATLAMNKSEKHLFNIIRKICRV